MVQSAAPRELHPLEVKVLLHYGEGDGISHSRLTADLGYNTGQVNQALSWLSAKGYVAETGRASRVFYEITELGRESLEKGTYEQRIVDLVAAEGALSLPDIARKLGIEAKDVGSAFGGLSKDKVLAMDGEKRAALAPGGREALAPKQSSLRSLLSRAVAGPLEDSALRAEEKELAASQAKKRGAAGSLFRLVEREEVSYAMTAAGAAAAAALKKAGATGKKPARSPRRC